MGDLAQPQTIFDEWIRAAAQERLHVDAGAFRIKRKEKKLFPRKKTKRGVLPKGGGQR